MNTINSFKYKSITHRRQSIYDLKDPTRYYLPAKSNSSRCRTKPALVFASNSSSSSFNGYDANNGRKGSFERFCENLSLGFPIFVVSAAVTALLKPSTFLWVRTDFQIIGLSITMLGMGMTLTLDDLKSALMMPKELAAGFVLQYTVMPMTGYIVSKVLKLPPHYAAGLILVACCPGGTASNLVTYLARGNVALSVLMTATSTLTAAVMTAFLTSKLAGQFVSVDPSALFTSTVQVVLAPVLIGAAMNQYCNSIVKIVSPIMPLIAITSVSILGGGAIAQNATTILSSGLRVVLPVLLLHGSGFLFGFWISRMMGIDVEASRTISIEVGMQNATLGLVLASRHFGSPETVVPCAVSGICHLIYGSGLAAFWRSMPVKSKKS